MVDRTERDRLAAAIEEFLAEDISAFKFDDRISAVAFETDDETVQEVAHLLWYHYDDIIDHTATLSKAEWDYFQRLLLLLRSDSSLATARCRRWLWRQAIAVAAIVAFVVGVFLLGFGWQTLLITIPLGVVSMALANWQTSDIKDENDNFVRLSPYASVSELLAVHRTVPAFRKRRYPGAMKSCRVGRPIAGGFLWLQTRLMWLVFSPVVLLCQTLPQSQRTSRVVPA